MGKNSLNSYNYLSLILIQRIYLQFKQFVLYIFLIIKILFTSIDKTKQAPQTCKYLFKLKLFLKINATFIDKINILDKYVNKYLNKFKLQIISKKKLEIHCIPDITITTVAFTRIPFINRLPISMLDKNYRAFCTYVRFDMPNVNRA